VGTLHENLFAFMIISRSDDRRMENVSGRVIEKIKTYILCSVAVFRKPCPLVGKCVSARQVTGDNIRELMSFVCRITKATDTHSAFLMLVTFSRQYLLRERASLLRYTFIACLIHLGLWRYIASGAMWNAAVNRTTL